jgi:hypothetical protein
LVKVNPKNSFGGYLGNNQTYIGTLTPGAFTLIQLDNPQMFGEVWPAVARCKQNGMVLLWVRSNLSATFAAARLRASWISSLTWCSALDANGQTLAYVYGHADPREAAIAKGLILDEARRIAANIAKLPIFEKPTRTAELPSAKTAIKPWFSKG